MSDTKQETFAKNIKDHLSKIKDNQKNFESYSLLELLCFHSEINFDARIVYLEKFIKYALNKPTTFKKKYNDKSPEDFQQLIALAEEFADKIDVEVSSKSEDKILCYEFANLINTYISEIENPLPIDIEYWKMGAKIKKINTNNIKNYNLIGNCYNAKPWKGRHQTEEFLTQAMSYCLSNHNKFKEDLLDKLNEKHKKENILKNVEIDGIEVQAEWSEGKNRPDIVFKEGGKILIAIENKVDANFDKDQINRYLQLNDAPFVFSLTLKDDCDDKNLTDNDSKWGGHLFWYDLLGILEQSINNVTNIDSNIYIYLKYFKNLIDSLYVKTEFVSTFDHNAKDLDKFRQYILSEFSKSFNQQQKIFSKIKEFGELYNLEITKENPNTWNSNDKKGQKFFHLMIKPNVNLTKFNNNRAKLILPFTSVRICFYIGDSEYIYDDNLEVKFRSRNLDVWIELNIFKIEEEQSKSNFSKFKNDSGLEIDRINELKEYFPDKLEELCDGIFPCSKKHHLWQIQKDYPSDCWQSSVLKFLKEEFEMWSEEEIFKKIIEWWGDDLNT